MRRSVSGPGPGLKNPAASGDQRMTAAPRSFQFSLTSAVHAHVHELVLVVVLGRR